MKPAAISLAIALLACSCGPSQECIDYVACQTVVDETVDTSDYDDDGSCWSLPSTARQCTAQCIEALAALQQVSDAPVCFPDEDADESDEQDDGAP